MCRRRIKPVLQNIKVEGAQINRGEIVERAVNSVKLEGLISRPDLGDYLRGSTQGPGVNFLELCSRHGILFRVEIIQIRKTIAEGISELAIRLGKACKNLGRNHHVLTKIDGSHPQAQDLSPMRLDHFVRVDPGAEGFRHGPALRVQYPTVGYHLSV